MVYLPNHLREVEMKGHLSLSMWHGTPSRLSETAAQSVIGVGRLLVAMAISARRLLWTCNAIFGRNGTKGRQLELPGASLKVTHLDQTRMWM